LAGRPGLQVVLAQSKRGLTLGGLSGERKVAPQREFATWGTFGTPRARPKRTVRKNKTKGNHGWFELAVILGRFEACHSYLMSIGSEEKASRKKSIEGGEKCVRKGERGVFVRNLL